MKHLLLAALCSFSLAVHAQGDDRTAKSSPHNVNVNGGFNYGGFTFGVGYEHMYDSSTGIGGHLRIFNKDDDALIGMPGLTIIGATLGHHFYKRAWDLAFTPSFNLINIDAARAGQEDVTTFGPGMSISLVWAMTDRASFGFDFTNYWVWFDDDWKGTSIDDLSAKLRLSF